MATNPDQIIPPELALDSEPFDLDQLDRAIGDDLPVPDVLASWAGDDPGDYQPSTAAVMRWTPRDDADAEWCMTHVAAIDAGLELLTEQTAAYYDRIRRHHTAAEARLTRRRQFFEAHLILYGAEHRARDPKRNKTLRLPSGEVKSVERKPTVDVADEATVIEWAKRVLPEDAYPAVVKHVPATEKLMVGELRKHAQVGRVLAGRTPTLACGHTSSVVIGVADDDGAPIDAAALPAAMPCQGCDPDPITGTPDSEVTGWTDVFMVAPVFAGVPVPGTEVKPGRIDWSVVSS